MLGNFQVVFTANFQPIIDAVQRFDDACDSITKTMAPAFTKLANMLEAYKPVRTRSGRWRVRLFKSDGSTRVAVYRTRTLALDAFVRSAERVSERAEL